MLAFSLFLLTFLVRADFELDGFTYHILNSTEKTVQVSKCNKSSDTTIKIPCKVKNDNIEYSVISISKTAFSSTNVKQFDTIYFPYTLEDIEEETFYSFSNLTKIGFTDEKNQDIDDTLPPLITTIHPNTFFSTSIKTITSNSVTSLETACFASCSLLVSAKFSPDLSIIGDEVFYGCISLESFEIGEKVTDIGTSAFRTCYSLQAIDLKNVAAVYNYAFQYCARLQTVNLRNVKIIAEYAFADLETLSSIEFPSSLTELHSFCFMRTPIKTVTGNPEKVTEIRRSFAFCESLVSVPAFPSLEIVNNESFYYCGNLERFETGEKLRVIGENAFSFCGKLNEFATSTSVFSVDHYSFRQCGALKSFQFSSVVSMSNNSFESCTGFTVVDLSGSQITDVTYHAFYRCSNLKEVILPPNMASISGGSPFQDCPIEKVIFMGTKGFVPIGRSFYHFESLKEVIFDASCLISLNSTFEGCINLVTVTLPSKNVSLFDSFRDCNSLEKVVNFNAVVKIEGAFTNCFALKTLDDASEIKAVGEMTFENCTSLTSLNFNNKLNEINDRAFKNCLSLTSIGDVLDIKTVGEMAFENCSSLISLNFNNKLTIINDRAFKNCHSLTTIGEIEQITTVGEMSFSNCYRLTSLHFGSKLTQIKDEAFSNCSGLLSVTFSPLEKANSELTIGPNSFDSCQSIESVIIEKVSTITISKEAFKNCESLTLFNSTIDDTFTIDEYAFYGCPLNDSITFESKTITVSHHSFSSSKLRTIEFASEVRKIELASDSFSDCSGVNCVIVESSLVGEVKVAFSEKVINGEFCPSGGGDDGSSSENKKKIAIIVGCSVGALVLIIIIVIIVVVKRKGNNYQQINENQSTLFNSVRSKN